MYIYIYIYIEREREPEPNENKLEDPLMFAALADRLSGLAPGMPLEAVLET